VVFPDITFTEKMTLHSGDLRIELVAVPAFHSDHDVLVVVPGNEVVAIGDVFFPGALPSISTEHAPHLSEFVREMSEFLALYPSVTTFVPGHGRLMSRLEIELIVRYLDQLDQGVSEAQAAGHSLDQTRRLLPLSELFADLELLGNSASATHEANLDVLWRSR
jgi:cyclase